MVRVAQKGGQEEGEFGKGVGGCGKGGLSGNRFMLLQLTMSL